MRDRSYRRWREELVVKKRLRRLVNKSSYWKFEDSNGDLIPNPRWINFIGRFENFQFKTLTTNKYDSKWKKKYSRNRNKGYDRDAGKSRGKGTRENSKKAFLKILDENGFKHVNFRQFNKVDYSEWNFNDTKIFQNTIG